MNAGSCVDHVNSFACNCIADFTGKLCQTNIRECVSNPCFNNATCNDLINGYSCSCSSGYAGILCQANINDCIPNPNPNPCLLKSRHLY